MIFTAIFKDMMNDITPHAKYEAILSDGTISGNYVLAEMPESMMQMISQHNTEVFMSKARTSYHIRTSAYGVVINVKPGKIDVWVTNRNIILA